MKHHMLIDVVNNPPRRRILFYNSLTNFYSNSFLLEQRLSIPLAAQHSPKVTATTNRRHARCVPPSYSASHPPRYHETYPTTNDPTPISPPKTAVPPLFFFETSLSYTRKNPSLPTHAANTAPPRIFPNPPKTSPRPYRPPPCNPPFPPQPTHPEHPSTHQPPPQTLWVAPHPH